MVTEPIGGYNVVYTQLHFDGDSSLWLFFASFADSLAPFAVKPFAAIWSKSAPDTALVGAQIL
jgi:hypothetical protein